MTVHGVAEHMVHEKFSMLVELESVDIYEEDVLEDFIMPSWSSERGGRVPVTVDSFGTAGDGLLMIPRWY